MMNNVNPNSPLGIPNNSTYVTPDQARDALKFALQEVAIGSQDTYELAMNMLRNKKIELQVLNELLEIYDKTPKFQRNLQFANKVNALQKRALAELNEKLINVSEENSAY